MRHKITEKIFTCLIIFGLVLSTSGCGPKKTTEKISTHKLITLTTEQEKRADIKTEALENRTIQLKINIPAQFKALTKFLDKEYAPVSGKITQIYVEPGDIVRKGQTLAEIKSDEIGQIQLAFLDDYIDIDASIKQSSVEYELAKQSYQREYTLFKEGISSRAEYEVAKAQMQKAKASLESSKIQKSSVIKVYAQRVALYGGSTDTILRAANTKTIYPYISIKSNKNGIVLDRKCNPGEVIEQNKELFSVADLSTIWLVGYAFEKDASLLKTGQTVVGILEEDSSKTVGGNLSYVSSVLDEERKTLEVRADIDNKNFSIKPNMYAEMVVNVGEVKALAVPNTALQQYGDYNFVYVKTAPNTYEERKVTIGQKNDKYSEVLSNLKEGEEVVTNGGFSLLGESIKMREK